jgi:hypothetical protein
MRERTLFLRWALLNVVAGMFLGSLGIRYGARVHGPSLVAVPLILAVWAYASAIGGRICWHTDGVLPGTRAAVKLAHDAKYVRHWAEQIQYMAMLSTVFGIWVLLTSQGGDLHDRLLAGGGVAFSATFVGIFASLILMQTQRMIEHSLEC